MAANKTIRLPDIDWHLMPHTTVNRYFSVLPEAGLSSAEISKRRATFGGNSCHGLRTHAVDFYKVKVRRDGQVCEVVLPELVLGDIVILEPGRRVPARLRLVTARQLQMHEALSESGQSLAHKRVHVGVDRANSARTGAVVVTGYGEGVVVAFDRLPHPRHDWRFGSRWLRRQGFVVQRPAVFGIVKRVRSIVVTAALSDSCIERVSYLAGQKGIELYVIAPADRDVPPDLSHVMRTFRDVPTVLRLVRHLHLQAGPCMWLHDGTAMHLYRGVADVTIAVMSAPDIDKLHADLLARGSADEAIERYLYNIL